MMNFSKFPDLGKLQDLQKQYRDLPLNSLMEDYLPSEIVVRLLFKHKIPDMPNEIACRLIKRWRNQLSTALHSAIFGVREWKEHLDDIGLCLRLLENNKLVDWLVRIIRARSMPDDGAEWVNEHFRLRMGEEFKIWTRDHMHQAALLGLKVGEDGQLCLTRRNRIKV